MAGNWRELRQLELEKQNREGYEVRILNRGEEVLYRKDDKSLVAEITHGNILYTHSLREWQNPKGTKLSREEYDLVLKRICEYLSFDGSKVTLDDRLPPTWEEQLAGITADAEREGWEVKEEDGNIVVERPPKDTDEA